VVVPVFRSGRTLVDLTERVDAALVAIPHEIILVDDGSPPETWAVVEGLAAQHTSVIGLRLGRNFGQHNALLAGVRCATFEVVVTIDDDLQNPPEEIPKLLDAMGDDLDVVYGAAPTMAQHRWRRVAGMITRWAMASALGGENAARMSAFRALRTDLRRGFAGEVGPAVSLDALLAWSTSRFGSVDVEHHPRTEGRSNYSFRRLLRFALDTATGYSALPLKLATGLGILTALFGVGVLGWVLGRLFLTGESVPGFPLLASTISIFAGVQLVTLGIMGEYLARMHFRLMRKPTYVVRAQVGSLADVPAGGEPEMVAPNRERSVSDRSHPAGEGAVR
jgi:glycosyltransferase involved in cell wall biosynthesis